MGDISALGHQHRHGTITFQKALHSILPLMHLFKSDLLGLFMYFTHFLPSSDSDGTIYVLCGKPRKYNTHIIPNPIPNLDSFLYILGGDG